jgi:GNAT superfamily N-acetyltransferase
MNPLERVQTHVRRYASEQRAVERVGPFLATFGKYSNGPYLNYAVPDDGAEPTRNDITDLVEVYRRKGLTPRVELVAELAPVAEDALCSAGFGIEGRFPLMICSPESVRSVDEPPGTQLHLPETAADYEELLEVRQVAFEEPAGVTANEVMRAMAGVEAGAFAAMVIDTASGRAVGSGACVVPYLGVSEVASIGVRREARRKGIGAFTTASLTKAAFNSGVELVYLTPATKEGERLYERVGFFSAGSWTHLGI